jgi:hypothetical protein
MSRTFAHLPSRIREDRGLHYDPAGTANLPTHGRAGYVRSIDRAEGARLVTSTARERRALIHTLTTIRSLHDAEDKFGTGDRWYDPCVVGRRVIFRCLDKWEELDPRTPTYDPTHDDEAQAIADREWEEEVRDWYERLPEPCPCCGRRD